MDDRDRRPPIALPGDSPIAQAISDLLFAQPHRGEIGGHGVDGGGIGQLVVLDREHAAAAFLVGVPRLPHVGEPLLAFDGDDLLDRQSVFSGEREVALVVAGHAHDRAVAVAHQHIVGDPHLDRFVGDRMPDVQARRHPFLFHGGEIGLDHRAAPAFVDERGERRVGLRRVLRQRMLRGDRAIRHAHDRVGAGGEHVHPAVADEASLVVVDIVRKRKAHAHALADPVGLHRLHALGPAGHLVEVSEQLLGVVGDLQVVHRDFALFDRRARSASRRRPRPVRWRAPSDRPDPS